MHIDKTIVVRRSIRRSIVLCHVVIRQENSEFKVQETVKFKTKYLWFIIMLLQNVYGTVFRLFI